MHRCLPLDLQVISNIKLIYRIMYFFKQMKLSIMGGGCI